MKYKNWFKFPSESVKFEQKVVVLIDCASYLDEHGRFKWIDRGTYSYEADDDFLVLKGQGIKARISTVEIARLGEEGKLEVF